MPVYIGSLGRMVKLPYVGSQQVQAEERYNFSSTLEGKRKAQVKPRGPRTWALSADHYRPNEHSLLSQFADGAWGPGPFVFVPVDAPHTNLLSLADSLCMDAFPGSNSVQPGGPVVLDSGEWAAASWSSNGSDAIIFNYNFAPVLPGQIVTGSAWVKGLNATARVYFYDANGNFMSVSGTSPTGDAMNYKRSSVTVSVPDGAFGVRIGATSAVGTTRPALTWTDSVQPWGDGQGCSKAVVSGFSRDQVLAVKGHTFSNVSFTVTEVG